MFTIFKIAHKETSSVKALILGQSFPEPPAESRQYEIEENKNGEILTFKENTMTGEITDKVYLKDNKIWTDKPHIFVLIASLLRDYQIKFKISYANKPPALNEAS